MKYSRLFQGAFDEKPVGDESEEDKLVRSVYEALIKAGRSPAEAAKIAEESRKKYKGAQDSFAFDRASVRTYDVDGRMHVELTNISKANVCPYYGREIPNSQELGLDPDRIYKLYRDPNELAKAAETFNNIPLLDDHIPISVDMPAKDKVCGSTGTDAIFVHPYLKNSLVVWTSDAISLIESEDKKELSSAYRYRADMTPGSIEGESYDGIMRDIVGNHVALVEQGRAGPDVVVGDAAIKLKGAFDMPKLMSRTAALAQGALIVALAPALAQDAKVVLRPLLADVTAKNFKTKKADILSGISLAIDQKIAKGSTTIAKDATIGEVTELLDALEEVEEDEAPETPKVDEPKTKTTVPSADSDPREFLKGKLSAEDMASYDEMCEAGKAKDEEMKSKEEEKKEKAMDSAIQAATQAATDNLRKTQRETREAEKEVRPYVGELAVVCDSAIQVYQEAFKVLGISTDGLDGSPVGAYKAILKTQPKPGDKPARPSSLGQDSAAMKGFADRYPTASRIRTS